MAIVTVRACRNCGAELPAQTAPGHPRWWCDIGCKRQAEYELKRVDRAVERAEQEIQWCHRAATGEEFAPTEVVNVPRRLAWWSSELERLKTRQLELLATPEEG